jgi:hypothetical protein
MKQKLLSLAVACSLFTSTVSIAQQSVSADSESAGLTCGTRAPNEDWEKTFEKQIVAYKSKVARSGRPAPYTLPVVVHVIYSSATEAVVGTGANLFAAQIQSQLDVLNQDFAGNAPGNSTLPTVFANVDANDVGISFCLATIGKTGNTLAEPGIDRISWQSKGWTNPTTFTSGNSVMNYFDNTIKPSTIWDPTKYLNIWVADFSNSGLYGYAKFPKNSTLTLNVINSDIATNQNDGIVVASLCFGSKTIFPTGYYNTITDLRSYGATAVHEIGHWLGLRHIWGDSFCATDYCNDTPVQGSNLYALCPTHPYNVGRCSGNTTGEMFQNYMGYTTDACMALFTAGQKTRMLTAMANAPNRKFLGTHGLCNAPAAAALPLGVNELNNVSNNIRMYPNPSSGLVVLDVTACNETISEMRVINAMGQIVETYRPAKGETAIQLSLHHLSKGIYTVALRNDRSNVAIKKLAIE